MYRKHLFIALEDFTIDIGEKLTCLKSKMHFLFIKENKLHAFALILIFIIAFTNRLLFLSSPFRYDEAFTYYCYVNTNILNALSNYSYPNNHIFHTFLVKITTFLFGTSLAAIRLPAFLSGVIVLPFAYLLIRKIFDKNIALFCSAFLACSYALIEYTVNARGYTIVLLLFVFLLLLANKKSRNQVDAFWIILISSLGFYTMPSFIIPYLVFLLWLIFLSPNFLIKHLATYVLGTLALTTVLYTPVFFNTGLQSIIANKYVISEKSYQTMILETILELRKTISWFFKGFPEPSLFIAVLGGFLGLIINKRKGGFLLFSSFLSMFLIVVVLKIIPLSRSLLFMLILLIPLCVQGFCYFIKSEMLICVLSVLFVFAFSLNLNKNKINLADDKSNFQYDKIAMALKKVFKNGDFIIAKLPLDYPFEFYLQKHQIPFSLEHVHNGGYSNYDTISSRVFVMIDKRYNKYPAELYNKQNNEFALLLKEGTIEVYSSNN